MCGVSVGVSSVTFSYPGGLSRGRSSAPMISGLLPALPSRLNERPSSGLAELGGYDLSDLAEFARERVG